MFAVRVHGLRRGHPQRHAGGAARAVLRRLDRAPFLRGRIAVSGLLQGSLTLVAGAAMLLSANFALSGQLAWTPGGYGVAFGRMLQDGIVKQYLGDHCPQQKLKLCPYRNELPATADKFLWGNSMFNTLGRFKGLNDEMGFIVRHSLAEYPAAAGRGRASSPPRSNWSMSEPAKAPMAGSATPTGSSSVISRRRSSRCARRISSTGNIDFTAINRLHVPVALASMLLVVAIFAIAASGGGGSTISRCSRRPSRLALLGNAFVCGVISGPHDRYGARLAWVATFVVLIAAVTVFRRRATKPETLTSAVTENPARPPCRPCRRPPACGRGSEYRAPRRPE